MLAIVETPKGSHQKFKFDEASGRFEVNKVLPGNMAFPFNFGFIPGTKGEDGDPLDVIIVSENVYATGDKIECRIIGCLPASQSSAEGTIRNDRFVAIPDGSRDYADINEIRDLPEGMSENFKSFFINYLAGEGKKVTFLPDLDTSEAKLYIKTAKLLTK